MIISILMMLAQATAPQAEPVTALPEIIVCPTEALPVPPFGESCDAKTQALRVADILRDRPKPKTVEITRYRMTGDGRTITNEQGNVVGIANPCLLPTEEKPKDLQASLNEPAPKPDAKSAGQPTGSPQSITRCKTETFAMQFVSPAGAGR